MLALLSNLNLVTRMEITTTAENMDLCLQGSWIQADGDVAGVGDISPGAAFQVWTEADRSKEKAFEAAHHTVASATWADASMTGLGAGHFSPDAADTVQLTVLYGKYRALTNMWVGSDPNPGDPLYISSDGFLTVDSSFTDADAYMPFAITTKSKADATHIGKTYSCIEYVTL